MDELEIYFNDVEFISISAVQATATGPDASGGCQGKTITGVVDRVIVVCASLRTGFFVAVEGTTGTTARAGALANPDQRPCVAGWKIQNPPSSVDVMSVDAASGIVTYAVTVPAFTGSWNAPVTASFTWADNGSPAGNGVTSTTASTTVTVTRRGNFFPGLNVVYLDPVNGCPSESKVVPYSGTCSAWSESTFAGGITVTPTSAMDVSSYTAAYTASVPSHSGRNGAPVTVTLKWADTLALAAEMIIPRTGGPFTLPLSKRSGPEYIFFPGLRVTVTSNGCASTEASVPVTAVTATIFSPPKGTTIFLDGAVPSYPNVAPMDNAALTTWKDKSGNGNDLTTSAGDVRFRTAPGSWHGYVQTRVGCLGRNGLASGTFTGGEFTVAMVFRATSGTADDLRYLSFGDATGADNAKGFTFESQPGSGFTSVVRYELGADSVRFTSQLFASFVGLPANIAPPGAWTFVSLTVKLRTAYLTVNSQDWYMNHNIGTFSPTKFCLSNAAQGTGGCDTLASGLVNSVDIASVLVWPRALSRSDTEELKVWAKARYNLRELHPRCQLIDKATPRSLCYSLMARWLVVPTAPVPKLLIDPNNIDGSGTAPAVNSNIPTGAGALMNTSPSKITGSDGTCSTNGGTAKYQTSSELPAGKGYIELRSGAYCACSSGNDILTTTGSFTIVALHRHFQRSASQHTGVVSMVKSSNDYLDNPHGLALRLAGLVPPVAHRGLNLDRPGCTIANIDQSVWQDRHATIANDFRLTTVLATPQQMTMLYDGYTRPFSQTVTSCPSSFAPTKWSVGVRMSNSGGAIDTGTWTNMDLASLQVFDRTLSWSEVQILRGTLYQSLKLASLLPNCTMTDRKYRHWCNTLQTDLSGVDLPRGGLVGEFSAEDPLGTGAQLATGTTITSWVNLAKPLAGPAMQDFSLANGPTFVQDAINGRPALRLNSGTHRGTGNIDSGVFPGNTATVMIVLNPLGTAGSSTWSGADNGGILSMGRQASPTCGDYNGADGLVISNNAASGTGMRDTRWLKSFGSSENAFLVNTNARALRPALTVAMWDQSSYQFSVGRVSNTGGWSGRSSFSPDKICLNGRYNAGSSCDASGAGADYAALFVWNKKLSASELETAKLYAMRAYKLDLDVDCTQVATSVRANCELEANSLPVELQTRLAFQLDADNYDGSGQAKDFGTTVTQWNNLRDSWLQTNAGTSAGASHGTCTTNAGWPKYNVYAPGSANFINNRGHIEFRGPTFCLKELSSTKYTFPSGTSSTALGLAHGRTLAILFRVAGNAAADQGILSFGTSSGNKEAYDTGLSLEIKSSGGGLWWVSRLNDGPLSLGISSTTVTGITTDANYAVGSGWTLGIFRVTTTGAFSMLNNNKFYDSTGGSGNSATATLTTTWGVGTRIMNGASSSYTYANLDVAFVLGIDGDVGTTEIELIRLWAKRKYGLAGLDIDCGEIGPRYQGVCTSAAAAP